MKVEWNEIEPGTYEARVGDWLLEVGRHDDELPWTLWVGLLNERETRGADPMCGTTYRRTVAASLDEAQRAAVALAVEKCAPFVAYAIRARTTPATLSTETLAAIAEARGLRLVDREVLSEVPVLQWHPSVSGPNQVAEVGRWVLEASTDRWTVMVTYENGGVKDEVLDGAAMNSHEAMLAAQDELRKLGVAFRTE